MKKSVFMGLMVLSLARPAFADISEREDLRCLDPAGTSLQIMHKGTLMSVQGEVVDAAGKQHAVRIRETTASGGEDALGFSLQGREFSLTIKHDQAQYLTGVAIVAEGIFTVTATDGYVYSGRAMCSYSSTLD